MSDRKAMTHRALPYNRARRMLWFMSHARRVNSIPAPFCWKLEPQFPYNSNPLPRNRKVQPQSGGKSERMIAWPSLKLKS